MNKGVPPVDIQINDAKKFLDVAFLIDREDFLEELYESRKRWQKFERLPIERQSKYWMDFPWLKEDKENFEMEKRRYSELNETLGDSEKAEELDLFEKHALIDEVTELRQTIFLDRFYFEVKRLRKKFRRPPNFDQIIAHAILYGVVTEEDYITCDARVAFPDSIDPQEPEVVITLYPLFREEEVLRVLREEIPGLMEEYESEFSENLIKYAPKRDITYQRNLRNWYWRKKAMSWSKLYQSIKESKEAILEDKTILEAVKDYEERLTVAI